MKKQIRRGVFETNSSSTHSICIAKNAELIFPKSVYFVSGEFGWEWDRLSNTHEKASYLYTALISSERVNNFLEIVSILKNENIDIDFEALDSFDGYIDHGDNLTKFLDDICSSKDKLMNFLFSPFSFILTGNDNSGGNVDINVKYEHDEYYKGN